MRVNKYWSELNIERRFPSLTAHTHVTQHTPRHEFPVTSGVVRVSKNTYALLYNSREGCNVINVSNSINTLLRVMRQGADCVAG